MKKYKLSISGGTFDHFHKGHQVFLEKQLALSEEILLGITSDTFIKNYKQKAIEPYATRLQHLQQFLASLHVLERVTIAPIDTNDIPSFWKSYPIEIIFSTADTKNGAIHINTIREREGKKVLPIQQIEQVYAQDGNILSSTRIRNGEVDRDGNLWVDPQFFSKTLTLPIQLRAQIQKPFGELFSSFDQWFDQNTLDSNNIIAVGDVVTESLLKKSFFPKVAVVDLFVQREKMYEQLTDHTLSGEETIIEVVNPAGTLVPELFEISQNVVKGETHYMIHVTGEEDLAVFPFILAAPLGFVIIYGQPNEGVIAITVTEAKKNDTKKLLEKFDF